MKNNVSRLSTFLLAISLILDPNLAQAHSPNPWAPVDSRQNSSRFSAQALAAVALFEGVAERPLRHVANPVPLYRAISNRQIGVWASIVFFLASFIPVLPGQNATVSDTPNAAASRRAFVHDPKAISKVLQGLRNPTTRETNLSILYTVFVTYKAERPTALFSDAMVTYITDEVKATLTHPEDVARAGQILSQLHPLEKQSLQPKAQALPNVIRPQKQTVADEAENQLRDIAPYLQRRMWREKGHWPLDQKTAELKSQWTQLLNILRTTDSARLNRVLQDPEIQPVAQILIDHKLLVTRDFLVAAFLVSVIALGIFGFFRKLFEPNEKRIGHAQSDCLTQALAAPTVFSGERTPQPFSDVERFGKSSWIPRPTAPKRLTSEEYEPILNAVRTIGRDPSRIQFIVDTVFNDDAKYFYITTGLLLKALALDDEPTRISSLEALVQIGRNIEKITHVVLTTRDKRESASPAVSIVERFLSMYSPSAYSRISARPMAKIFPSMKILTQGEQSIVGDQALRVFVSAVPPNVSNHLRQIMPQLSRDATPAWVKEFFSAA
jgi:hypothetical protein